MKREVKSMHTIVYFGPIPVRSSLWWIWFLSGRNGLRPSRILDAKTRTTSSIGITNVLNAMMPMLWRWIFHTALACQKCRIRKESV